MSDKPSHTQDRAETRAARAAERAGLAETVWAEVEIQKAITDEKTARLKAQRIAREAEETAAREAKSAAKR